MFEDILSSFMSDPDVSYGGADAGVDSGASASDSTYGGSDAGGDFGSYNTSGGTDAESVAYKQYLDSLGQGQQQGTKPNSPSGSLIPGVSNDNLLRFGGPLVGGALSGSAAQRAGNSQASAAQNAALAQSQAARDANNTQLAMFDQIRADNMPWKQVGQTALDQLSAGTQSGGQFSQPFSLKDFENDPGRKFAIQQGQEAVSNSAAARGSSLSPNTSKALADYTVGAENQFYNQFLNQGMSQRQQLFNQLSSLAGIGQSSLNQTSNAGLTTSNIVGNNQIGAGNANAAGTVGAANANAAGNTGYYNGIGGGVNSGVNSYLQNQSLQNIFGNNNSFNSGSSGAPARSQASAGSGGGGGSSGSGIINDASTAYSLYNKGTSLYNYFNGAAPASTAAAGTTAGSTAAGSTAAGSAAAGEGASAGVTYGAADAGVEGGAAAAGGSEAAGSWAGAGTGLGIVGAVLALGDYLSATSDKSDAQFTLGKYQHGQGIANELNAQGFNPSTFDINKVYQNPDQAPQSYWDSLEKTGGDPSKGFDNSVGYGGWNHDYLNSLNLPGFKGYDNGSLQDYFWKGSPWASQMQNIYNKHAQSWLNDPRYISAMNKYNANNPTEFSHPD